MKIFSFNEDSDRLVVVKKSEGEMTVVIKLKNADKESENKMNFTPKRLVYVYNLHTRDQMRFMFFSISQQLTLTYLLPFGIVRQYSFGDEPPYQSK